MWGPQKCSHLQWSPCVWAQSSRGSAGSLICQGTSQKGRLDSSCLTMWRVKGLLKAMKQDAESISDMESMQRAAGEDVLDLFLQRKLSSSSSEEPAQPLTAQTPVCCASRMQVFKNWAIHLAKMIIISPDYRHRTMQRILHPLTQTCLLSSLARPL